MIATVPPPNDKGARYLEVSITIRPLFNSGKDHMIKTAI